MPNIKIIENYKKPEIPKSKDLSAMKPRFRPPQGKPPLPSTSSYKNGKSS